MVFIASEVKVHYLKRSAKYYVLGQKYSLMEVKLTKMKLIEWYSSFCIQPYLINSLLPKDQMFQEGCKSIFNNFAFGV